MRVDEMLPGHAHYQTPAHPPKAGSELVGGCVPQGHGVKTQEDNRCQSLNTPMADSMKCVTVVIMHV